MLSLPDLPTEPLLSSPGTSCEIEELSSPGNCARRSAMAWLLIAIGLFGPFFIFLRPPSPQLLHLLEAKYRTQWSARDWSTYGGELSHDQLDFLKGLLACRGPNKRATPFFIKGMNMAVAAARPGMNPPNVGQSP
uniref:Uncharacterized protein n=1 Tax=Fagus sylvatica TaxID=28930 RepID=A0A2N9G1H4_FAGSY